MAHAMEVAVLQVAQFIKKEFDKCFRQKLATLA